MILLSGCATIGPGPTEIPTAPYENTPGGAETPVVEETLSAVQTIVAQLTNLAATPTSRKPVKRTPTASGRERNGRTTPTIDPSGEQGETTTGGGNGNGPGNGNGNGDGLGNGSTIPVMEIVTETPTPGPPTETPIPSATPVLQPCLSGELLGDISVSDGTRMTPGAVFTKAWRLRNTGSCYWTRDFNLVYTGGDLMGTRSQFNFTTDVAPGESAILSLDLTAPTKEGVYRGLWMLRSDDGNVFGLGKDKTQALHVEIKVTSYSYSYGSYNLTTDYCNAAWTSNAGVINCTQGTETGGFVSLQSQASIETGVASENILWVHPNQSRNGYIRGEYPAYTVRKDDHFKANIGCMKDSKGCHVSFTLEYDDGSGDIVQLGQWEEAYDGVDTTLDIDLSELEGQSVQFILTTAAIGKPAKAEAYWLNPHIEGAVTSQTQEINWRKYNSDNSICDGIRVYLTGSQSGEIFVYNCENGAEDGLNWSNLTTDQLNQFQTWASRFKTFSAEQSAATDNGMVTHSINLQGWGVYDASASEIDVIIAYCQDLFNSLSQ